jgi:hypothetical protein
MGPAVCKGFGAQGISVDGVVCSGIAVPTRPVKAMRPLAAQEFLLPSRNL